MTRLIFLFFAFLLFQQAISEIQDNGSVLIACILFLISAFIGLYLLITILGIKDKIKRIGLLEGIKAYFRSIHRLSLTPAKRQAIVWADLKNTYSALNWDHSVNEDKKGIEAGFILKDRYQGIFIYQFEDDQVLYRGLIFEEFPDDMTSDLFILATHINNVLKIGMVTINMRDHFVEFVLQEPLVKPFLYPEDIKDTILEHLRIVNETIFPCFYRLIYEEESPAIIIADLLKGTEDKSE